WREDLIVKDVPRDVVADGRSRYDRWHLTREDARASSAVPSIRVATVHELVADSARALSESADPASISITTTGDSTAASVERTGGSAFGILVHAVLADVALEA